MMRNHAENHPCGVGDNDDTRQHENQQPTTTTPPVHDDDDDVVMECRLYAHLIYLYDAYIALWKLNHSIGAHA